MKIINTSNNAVLVDEILISDNFFSRFKGLMFKKGLEPGKGMLIKPCSMIHTFFMRFPIDVVFVSKENKVVHTVESLKPWRSSELVTRATAVIELPADTIKHTQTKNGDYLKIKLESLLKNNGDGSCEK